MTLLTVHKAQTPTSRLQFLFPVDLLQCSVILSIKNRSTTFVVIELCVCAFGIWARIQDSSVVTIAQLKIASRLETSLQSVLCAVNKLLTIPHTVCSIQAHITPANINKCTPIRRTCEVISSNWKLWAIAERDETKRNVFHSVLLSMFHA